MKILYMDDGNVRPIESSKFEEEAVLQTYLEEHPDLLPLHEIEDNPAPLVTIGREVSVPSGSIDLLFVDTKGVLTIVETKLAKNPEVRREVIGQIIEYASFVSQWDAQQVERQATEYFRSKGAEASLYGVLAELAKAGNAEVPPDEATLRSAIEKNLGKGNIRLIIAVDELVESLRSTVTFLNSFSTFDLLILQLRDFELGATKRILIPSVFGYARKGPPPPPPQWEKDRFLKQASQKAPASVRVFERLIGFAESEGATVWGRGASIGTFGCVFTSLDGTRVTPFSGMANGKISIGFWDWAKRLDQGVVAAYRQALARVEGMPPEAVQTDTWRDVDVSFLASEQSLDAFLQAIRALKQAVTGGKSD